MDTINTEDTEIRREDEGRYFYGISVLSPRFSVPSVLNVPHGRSSIEPRE